MNTSLNNYFVKHFSGCFWIVKGTNLLSKQYISFSSNADRKKKHLPEKTQLVLFDLSINNGAIDVKMDRSI